MSSFLPRSLTAAALLALTLIGSPALAQSDDADLELRVQRLENQLRQLTGQNEELQYRNRQLEERLRQLQGGQPATAPQAAQPVAPAQPPQAAAPVYPAQPSPQREPQIAAPAPIVQEPAMPPVGNRRRGDAFDPSQNPNAPGAPQALGGGQLPVQGQPPAGNPAVRVPGAPIDLANPAVSRPPPSAAPVVQGAPVAGGLTTAPPAQTPRDEYDLGIGYMQRRDYALAEETMRNFAQKYPNDPLVGDSQYWLGESHFQRQQYRDAAEVFLAVSTKYDKSAKAPDALLRLGQSLAALKEREAACAALGEVLRKYPRASAGVKTAVDREQKRIKC